MRGTHFIDGLKLVFLVGERTCDWFTASRAALGEELSEAVGTVGLVVTGGEPLSG